jgi:hypothetical protein
MALRILGWPGGAQERHFPIGTTFRFLGEVIFRREPVVEILRNIHAKYPGEISRLDARVESVISGASAGMRPCCVSGVNFFPVPARSGHESQGQIGSKEINLAVPELFRTIEESGFSSWIRKSDSVFGFYFILLFHTIGLSLLVGANAVVDLRILGVASDLPLKPLKRFFGIMWVGLAINVTTGILLLTAYPTKALTNPVFYVKLSFIGLAVITMQRINSRLFADASLSEAAMIAKGKTMAKCSLLFWLGAITAGRLLSETYTYLTYGHSVAR